MSHDAVDTLSLNNTGTTSKTVPEILTATELSLTYCGGGETTIILTLVIIRAAAIVRPLIFALITEFKCGACETKCVCARVSGVWKSKTVCVCLCVCVIELPKKTARERVKKRARVLESLALLSSACSAELSH